MSMHPKFNSQICEEAAIWFIEFRYGDATPESRRAFCDWLRLSPEHLRAYLEIAAIWNEGGAIDVQRRYPEDELIALARGPENVVPLPARAATPTATPAAMDASGSLDRRFAVGRRFAVAAVLLLGAISLFTWVYVQRGVYSTEVGEQRSLALADGSTVQLNSRSRIRIRYSEAERRVELLEGQALFRVAKHAGRPFLVESERALIRAVGTQFDVYRRPAGTTVTVIEGRVAVETAGAGPEAVATPSPRERNRLATIHIPGILVSAGEQLIVAPGASPEPAKANVATATAWTQRQIVFESASLAQVAEEFNRYNRLQLVIEDQAAVDFHITGTFSSTDPSSLVRFLRERRGLEVVEAGDEIRIHSR